MNEKLEKIIDLAKKTSMTNEEKLGMLENIKSFVESNTKVPDKIVSPYATAHDSLRLSLVKSLFSNLKQRKFMPIAVFLILVLGTSSVSAAARNSLPGDVLYPIKIHMNEKIESLLAVGAKSDAEVHLKQINRRLLEAEKLAKENKLTPKRKDQLKNNFNIKVTAMKGDLDKLSNKGDADVANSIKVKFESGLDDHILKLDKASETEVYLDISNKDEDSRSNLRDFTTFVKKERKSNSRNDNDKIENKNNIDRIKEQNDGIDYKE